MLCFYGACTFAGFAQPVAITPRWQVNFPATANGIAVDSTAVPVDDGSILVVVVAVGADPMNPKLQVGNRMIPVKVIGHDPVSRLEFLKVEGSERPKQIEWSDEVGANASAALRTVEPGGAFKCRTTGWVKQVGGKILPLALLRVSFSRAIPPPGTPLVDDSGRVVGIFFQSAGAANSGYAIPAEAVHRVRTDLCGSGKVVRGWLGLALRADSQLPQISRILPDSPAAAAGARVNDVILSIGNREVTEYADAANAFFYLVPGQPVRVKLLRNAEQLELTLTPTKPRDP
ncbi:MAG: S1C family serine protease [Luteolibacter sp.]|uniref:S1C family serine protease n=1 Tax=Luteolibacter sp. TaxID=1962973 RepID=UPI003263E807